MRPTEDMCSSSMHDLHVAVYCLILPVALATKWTASACVTLQ